MSNKFLYVCSITSIIDYHSHFSPTVNILIPHLHLRNCQLAVSAVTAENDSDRTYKNSITTFFYSGDFVSWNFTRVHDDVILIVTC